jgi:hypothetical protein
VLAFQLEVVQLVAGYKRRVLEIKQIKAWGQVLDGDSLLVLAQLVVEYRLLVLAIHCHPAQMIPVLSRVAWDKDFLQEMLQQVEIR